MGGCESAILGGLRLVLVPGGNVASYWAGFCWDKAGPITAAPAWNKYVDEFAQGLRAPVQVSVSSE